MFGAHLWIPLIAVISLASPHAQTQTWTHSQARTRSHEVTSQHIVTGLHGNISTARAKNLFFTQWSSWSSCLDQCKQSRQRRCQLEDQCGTTVHKETRDCSDKQRRLARCRNKHRHRHGDFHVIALGQSQRSKLPPAADEWRRGDIAAPREGRTRQQPVAERVRARQAAYESKLYGKWSRWSQCTRSCTTQRRRLCKRRDLCGGDVIRETAYCYLEGSFCQRWIYRKIQETEEENEAGDYFWFDSAHDAWSPASERTAQSGPDSDVSSCGVSGDSSSRSLGNLLRIIGGRPTVKGRWPWQVAVLNRFREAFCGGTLVSARWVLTAAHCVRKRLYVRIGEHDLAENEGTETELRIELAVTHPSYDAETVDNDVALLRLPTAITPDRYQSFACLPRHRQALPTAKYCTIIGWGKRASADTFGTDVLHEAKVPIVPNEACRSVYQEYHITGNMFCAGYRRGRMDSCAGDSGGPLLCQQDGRWTIFGITSFGEGCGKKGKYGIYTRLANYVRWIHKTVREKR